MPLLRRTVARSPDNPRSRWGRERPLIGIIGPLVTSTRSLARFL
jgi:hypothetical protein